MSQAENSYFPHQLLQILMLRRKPHPILGTGDATPSNGLSNTQGYSGSQESLGAGRSVVMTEGHVPPTQTQSLQLRHCLSSTVQNITCDIQPSNKSLRLYFCADLAIVHEKLRKPTPCKFSTSHSVSVHRVWREPILMQYGRGATSTWCSEMNLQLGWQKQQELPLKEG